MLDYGSLKNNCAVQFSGGGAIRVARSHISGTYSRRTLVGKDYNGKRPIEIALNAVEFPI